MRCPKCLGARRVRASPYEWGPCDLCEGLGVVEFSVAAQYITANPKSVMARRVFEAETKVVCVECDGTGQVTATVAAEQRARKNRGDP